MSLKIKHKNISQDERSDPRITHKKRVLRSKQEINKFKFGQYNKNAKFQIILLYILQ